MKEFDEEIQLKQISSRVVSVCMGEALLAYAETVHSESNGDLTPDKIDHARIMLTVTCSKKRLELDECFNAVLKALHPGRRPVKKVNLNSKMVPRTPTAIGEKDGAGTRSVIGELWKIGDKVIVTADTANEKPPDKFGVDTKAYGQSRSCLCLLQ